MSDDSGSRYCRLSMAVWPCRMHVLALVRFGTLNAVLAYPKLLYLSIFPSQYIIT